MVLLAALNRLRQSIEDHDKDEVIVAVDDECSAMHPYPVMLVAPTLESGADTEFGPCFC